MYLSHEKPLDDWVSDKNHTNLHIGIKAYRGTSLKKLGSSK